MPSPTLTNYQPRKWHAAALVLIWICTNVTATPVVGAFKTPTLRDIDLTAPYFHDGSANTLPDVIEHYVGGGEVKSNLSPEMKPIKLSAAQKNDLITFLQSLTNSTEPQIPAVPVVLNTPCLTSSERHGVGATETNHTGVSACAN